LTDVIFVEEAVHTAVLLIYGYNERDWMSCFVGYGLEFLD
jgi:hypothetical protein